MTKSPRILVVGSGAIGLRTSIELIRRGVSVVLQSPCHPLDESVCSQGAGGLWMPFHCDDPRTDKWAMETLDEIHPLAKKASRERYLLQQRDMKVVDSDEHPVEIVPTVILKRNSTEQDSINASDLISSSSTSYSSLPSWSKDSRLNFQHMTIEMLWWQNQVLQLRLPGGTMTTAQEFIEEYGYRYAWLFYPPIVDCPNMLLSMLQEVEVSSLADVNVDTGHYYQSMEEMIEQAKLLGCTGLINCTGLGSSKLCNDAQLIGARGILLHYDRDTCIRTTNCENNIGEILPQEQGREYDANILTEDEPWGSSEFPCYMIVRGKKIVIGGSYLEYDQENMIRRPKEYQHLIRNATNLGIDPMKNKPISEWTGFRPYRPISRCEVDTGHDYDNNINNNGNNVRVVHSYGYGGSGWTVFVGCAKEASDLVLNGI